MPCAQSTRVSARHSLLGICTYCPFRCSGRRGLQSARSKDETNNVFGRSGMMLVQRCRTGTHNPNHSQPVRLYLRRRKNPRPQRDWKTLCQQWSVHSIIKDEIELLYQPPAFSPTPNPKRAFLACSPPSHSSLEDVAPQLTRAACSKRATARLAAARAEGSSSDPGLRPCRRTRMLVLVVGWGARSNVAV